MKFSSLLVITIITLIGARLGQSCDCYTYWECDGAAQPVFPDCISNPPQYFGPGVVVPGNTGNPFGYLVISNSSDQAYRFVGANCVQQLQFGDCPAGTVSIRNDFERVYDCSGNAVCVSAGLTADPADMLNYTVDKGTDNPDLLDCSCLNETSCTIPETAAPTCATASNDTEVPLDELSGCGVGGFTFRTGPPTLELTHDIGNEIAAAYRNKTYDLRNGFTLSAHIHIFTTDLSDSADGFVFVIQQDPLGCSAVGAKGQGIAYGSVGATHGIVRAFAVEFDDYQNDFYLDPVEDHVAVQASSSITAEVDSDHNAGSPSLVISPIIISIAPNGNGGPFDYDVTVSYVKSTQTLTVIFDGATVINTNIGDRYDRLDFSNAYFGFTSSTGGDREAVEISEMAFTAL